MFETLVLFRLWIMILLYPPSVVFRILESGPPKLAEEMDSWKTKHWNNLCGPFSCDIWAALILINPVILNPYKTKWDCKITIITLECCFKIVNTHIKHLCNQWLFGPECCCSILNMSVWSQFREEIRLTRSLYSFHMPRKVGRSQVLRWEDVGSDVSIWIFLYTPLFGNFLEFRCRN